MSQTFNGPDGWDYEIVPETLVQWQVTSQAGATQSMQIYDPDGHLVVETAVKSTDLRNTSIGNFPVGAGGKYRIKFPNDHTVAVDTAAVIKGRVTATETALFGGEDSSDSDYNDVFATVTWFNRKG